MLNIILSSIFGFWTLFVWFYYFDNHENYQNAIFNSPWIYSAFFFTLSIIFWAFFLYKTVIKDEDKIFFKKSPILIIWISIFSFFTIATIFYTKTLISKEIDYFPWIFSLISKLSPSILTLFVIFSLSFLFWDTLSKILKIKWAEEKKWLVNIWFWLTFILFILFIIWVFWLLTADNIFILWGVLCLISYKSFWDFWDWLTSKNKKSTEFKFFSIDTFLWISLFFMISSNISDLIRPMPIWWDDMWVYLNMPQRIAEDATVLSGQWGQAYMLLTSIWYSLWPDYVWDNVAMFINWFWWILSIFAVYVFTRRFFNEKMALFTSTFYYFMPMITFQSALDMKMDPPLFFFMTTWALILLDKWNWILSKINDLIHRITLEDKIKWAIWWTILATAFLIKITTAMELFAIFAVLWYFIFNWKTSVWIILIETSIFLLLFSQIPEFSDLLKQSLSFLFLILWIFFISISKIKKHQLIHFKDISISFWIWFLIIALPWFAFNYNDSRSLSFWGITSWAFNEAIKIDYEKLLIDREWVDKEYCTSTGSDEERWRYIWHNQPFFKKYFTLPWKNTMNSEIKWYYLDIWFLYLALIPWLFLLWIYKRFWKKEWAILILFCVNWFFWAFSAFWIPWYWLFWFLPALVLAWMVLYDKELNKTEWKYFFTFLIFISIFSFAYLRETKSWNWVNMQYAYWLKTWEQVIDAVVPTYRKTVEMIDIYPRTEDNKWLVYRIWTFIPYFIKDSRRLMITDSQLSIFKCLDWDWKDDKRTLKRLKKLWFKFFILDTNTATIEKFEHISSKLTDKQLAKFLSLWDEIKESQKEINPFLEKFSKRELSLFKSLKNKITENKWVNSSANSVKNYLDRYLEKEVIIVKKIKELETEKFRLLKENWTLHKKFTRFVEFSDNFKMIYIKKWIAFMSIDE